MKGLVVKLSVLNFDNFMVQGWMKLQIEVDGNEKRLLN